MNTPTSSWIANFRAVLRPRGRPEVRGSRTSVDAYDTSVWFARRRWLQLAALACLSVSCGSDTEALEDYDQLVESSLTCDAGTTCAMTTGILPCRCPVAVRDDAAAELTAAAQEASCPDEHERLFCPPRDNPRCEQGRCVSDEVPEG